MSNAHLPGQIWPPCLSPASTVQVSHIAHPDFHTQGRKGHTRLHPWLPPLRTIFSSSVHSATDDRISPISTAYYSAFYLSFLFPCACWRGSKVITASAMMSSFTVDMDRQICLRITERISFRHIPRSGMARSHGGPDLIGPPAILI